ncbi:MAG TPA: creatininase family protein [Solirubrobacteraceae bacterium]|jgi:creatinine amidohydrolase|nr:creatininase family protein [Solirubrobacteraceae bacterium]
MAIELDKLTWPQVKAHIDAGRDTVVMALGATEQHAHHMPLATDALLGDHLARVLAERLDALLAPTVRVGCSEHHLGFPGTISLAEETFHALVGDLARSLLLSFRRVVFVPTHGGNFAPLAAAVAKLERGDAVIAVTDLDVLLQIPQLGESEFGVSLARGGIHAGEWETSMLLAIHPELVDMAAAEPGFTGELQDVLPRLFREGAVAGISPTGALGDPTPASAAHGERYWSAVVELIAERIEASARARAADPGRG